MPRGQRNEGARRRVLAALAAGASVCGAARSAGCSRSTVYGWAARGDERVAQALTDRRRTAGGGTPEPEPVDELADSKRAVGLAVLEEVALDTTARTADRVSAARALASLCGAVRRRAATQHDDSPQPRAISADAATKRFRVVG